MRPKWGIKMTRKAARRYFYWEWPEKATARARKLATWPGLDSTTFVRLTAADTLHSARTRAEVERWAGHIRQVLAWQLGKLGKPLGDSGGVYVTRLSE